jgi:hypothetical protein
VSTDRCIETAVVGFHRRECFAVVTSCQNVVYSAKRLILFSAPRP